jgi:hypothetical protein
VRKHLDRHLHLRLDFQLCPHIPHVHDQILKDRHFRFGSEIELLLVGLRISRQRNRLQRRLALVDRLPDLFRDKRHHRMQQPQRRVKKINQIAASDSRLRLVGVPSAKFSRGLISSRYQSQNSPQKKS